MASTAAPFGARPIGSLSATGSWTAKRMGFPIASAYDTSIFYGDFVTLVAAGTVEKDAQTTVLDPVGIFVGCDYTDPTSGQFVNSQYWPANNAATDAVAWVVTDPDVLFVMQANGSLAAADLNLNCAVVQTAGSTSVGTSKNSLNAASKAVTATLPIRIVGFVDGPDSAAGDAYTDVICRFNTPSDPATATGHQMRIALGL